ncbi:aho-3 [Symbiodinium sp. KB8]|nr:aho-3 [Symbiodinium sp. KB8]
MTLGLQWIVDKITFPSPQSSYSLTSHPELFFVPRGKSSTHPGVPCMLYAVRQGAPVLLVHAHSNGCDIGDMRQTLHSISESLKVHVMSFEFPGYGLHMGHASMRSIDEAASAVLNYIANDLRINLSQVVWYGRSIGSGPALRAVHRISKELKQQPGGVVLQCGFANFPEVAGHLFGRVAKRLVNRLWPNEAMMKEIRCPVLLIHGRNDTMIPISQSEKLWEAVSMKELSNFHSCDCGHNDFNFRRCTLRPIYDFLLGVISSPSFPSTNFQIDVDSSCRASIRHIGPLRSRIPVYSFKTRTRQDWLVRISDQKSEAAKAIDDTSPQAAESAKSMALNEEQVKREDTNTTQKTNATAKMEGRELKSPPSGLTQPSPPPSKRMKGKKGKAQYLEPTIVPDFSIMPPIQDAEQALCDPQGLVRTYASRISLFLQRVQRQLDRIEGLEHKTVEEIADFVEAEFWACDPLPCLWEEVSLPYGESVRYRIGPFSLDSQGRRSYEQDNGTGRSTFGAGPQLLRVPLWVFTPSTGHFRCLTEWSLLHSERLRRILPAAGDGGNGCCGGCCAAGFRRKSAKSSKIASQPSMGALSTMLAGHYVQWVNKNEEIRGMVQRFVRLYNNPEEIAEAPAEAVQALKTPEGDTAPLPEKEGIFPPNILSGSVVPTEEPMAKIGPAPGKFSAACRKYLLEGMGVKTQTLIELAMRLRFPATAFAQEAERQDGAQLSNPADFRATAEIVANPTLQVLLGERYADWASAGYMLHYERLPAAQGNRYATTWGISGEFMFASGTFASTSANGQLYTLKTATQEAGRGKCGWHDGGHRQSGDPEPALPEEAKPTSPMPTSMPAMQAMQASHVEGNTVLRTGEGFHVALFRRHVSERMFESPVNRDAKRNVLLKYARISSGGQNRLITLNVLGALVGSRSKYSATRHYIFPRPPEKERALPSSDNPAGSTLPMESDETDVNDPTTS